MRAAGDDAPSIVRQAVAQDAAEIAEVHVAAWRATFCKILPTKVLDDITYEKRLMLWQGLLAKEAGVPLVLVGDCEPGGCQGFVWMRRLAVDAAFDAEIVSICVHPDHQRRSLGRRLMSAAADRLHGLGAKSCYLWVFAANRPARSFYEALGGRVTDEGRDMIGDFEVPTLAYAWRPLSALRQL